MRKSGRKGERKSAREGEKERFVVETFLCASMIVRACVRVRARAYVRVHLGFWADDLAREREPATAEAARGASEVSALLWSSAIRVCKDSPFAFEVDRNVDVRTRACVPANA